MKTAGLLFSLVSAASAAPALVWKDELVTSSEHHSADVSFEKVMDDAFSGEGLNVVFLLGRSENGEESLTSLTSSGALPGIASKSETAHCVHHHVSNVQNAQSVTGMANGVGKGTAMKVSLNELAYKLEALSTPEPEAMEVAPNGMVAKAVHVANKRSRSLKEAKVLIVDVPAKTSAEALDGVVVSAIESKAVGAVVLTSVRSVQEVKHERDMRVHHRRVLMEQEGRKIVDARNRRRRLEDWNGDQQDDISGTYYVSMTPNILAGILFFMLFTVVTLIGISCMGMIQGQDVYVNKMPTVGREA